MPMPDMQSDANCPVLYRTVLTESSVCVCVCWQCCFVKLNRQTNKLFSDCLLVLCGVNNGRG